MEARMLFIHALTPLHPGTGQGVGVIDLPVAREAATGLPYLPGSSLKGVLRDRCGDNGYCKEIFGPETNDKNDSKAAAALFTDQRLLLLPVRSLAGTFAWVTSPFILQRLLRDRRNAGDLEEPTQVSSFLDGAKETALVTGSNKLSIAVGGEKKIILEDLELQSKAVKNAREWSDWLAARLFADDPAWQKTVAEKFCIVHDDVFSFLLQTATEVIARNQLTEDKTSNNLWYEEALPAETVLCGLVVAHQVGDNGLAPDEVFAEVDKLTGDVMQLGGNATIGRGLCRLSLTATGGANGHLAAETG